MRALWHTIEPQTKEEYHRTRSEIAELLTPEQREKMQQMRRGRDRGKDRTEEKKKDAPNEKKHSSPEARFDRGGSKQCIGAESVGRSSCRAWSARLGQSELARQEPRPTRTEGFRKQC
jgi:hypothetical protein